MSEYRRDPITGRWAIVAESRAARPNEYLKRVAPSAPEDCPFCPGHESWTPPEVAALRSPGSAANGPGWTVRTVPNKFPSLAASARPDGRSPRSEEVDRLPGYGVHEVVIETPEHGSRFSEFPPETARAILAMARDRVRALSELPEIASVITFENSGDESGGTLFHPHLQLVALPSVPLQLAEELSGARRYAAARSVPCALESVVATERAAQERLVRETPTFTAYCPFASEYPFEVRIVPRHHAGSLAEATDVELDGLSTLLPAVLRALEKVRPMASYNLVLRSFAPVDRLPTEYHWHLDLLPRLIRPDGFELGSGIPVNAVAPESAAQELRGALGDGAR